MLKRTDLIAMVWAPYEDRTASFAEKLNATLYNIHYMQYKRPYIAPFKYIFQALKTFQILISKRPDYIYITNPPSFAPLCVMIFCKLFGKQFVMDTHPPALYSKKWGWTVPLQRFVSRHAMMNVTDQKRYKELFESWGAKCLVMENPLERDIDIDSLEPTRENFEVAVVNTFAEDEPFDIILEAARQLSNVIFRITGDIDRADPILVKSAPDNVQFTGYLRGTDYWDLISSTRATMVLTTFPNSLVGGGMDGIILGKPLILSDQPTLREYFTKGTAFAENTTEGLLKGVQHVLDNEEALKNEIAELNIEKKKQWKKDFQNLQRLFQKNPSEKILESQQ